MMMAMEVPQQEIVRVRQPDKQERPRYEDVPMLSDILDEKGEMYSRDIRMLLTGLQSAGIEIEQADVTEGTTLVDENGTIHSWVPFIEIGTDVTAVHEMARVEQFVRALNKGVPLQDLHNPPPTRPGYCRDRSLSGRTRIY